MTINHEEARRLIQFKADEALREVDNNLLEAHLRSCPDCQSYKASIDGLESFLRPLMQRKWNQYPLPLPTKKAVSQRYANFKQTIFFATRILAMGLICIGFIFNIWQYTKASGQKSSPPAAAIPLIPTPSLQSTRAEPTDQKCASILYTVQTNDTLESIADQFSVPAEKIRHANNLKTETLNSSMKLSIPICEPTPSGTPNMVRTTFTPFYGSKTLTPVNSPTQ
jgi:hypothetical protein